MKSRILAIDILKAAATLLIFNHISQRFYGSSTYFAAGGVIGCTLFFFCSGFGLSFGRMECFGTWYKKRLMRIWPSSFVAAAVYGVVFSGGGGRGHLG